MFVEILYWVIALIIFVLYFYPMLIFNYICVAKLDNNNDIFDPDYTGGIKYNFICET